MTLLIGVNQYCELCLPFEVGDNQSRLLSELIFHLPHDRFAVCMHTKKKKMQAIR